MLRIALTAVAAWSLAAAGPVAADWSAPQAIGVPESAAAAVAVNARGDAAVAWATRPSSARPPAFRTSVHVAVRSADGRLRSRLLWNSRRSAIQDLAVAVAPRGEVTVAWLTHTRRDQVTVGGQGTVRASYGSLTGRWARARTVGRGLTEPRLAVAPDGTALLSWVGTRVIVAWRSAGRPFGAPTRLTVPHARPGLPNHGPVGAIPAFDARGRAYLAGECEGVVARAQPRSRRFTRVDVLDRSDTLGLQLAVVGAGNGLATWIRGHCSADAAAGDVPGPVLARVLLGGRFSDAIAVSAPDAQVGATATVADPGGGGTVTWATFLQPDPVLGARLGPGGVVEAAHPVSDRLTPIAADGGGDQVLSGPGASLSQPEGLPTGAGVVVRPAGGAPDQVAPASSGLLAAATPAGRAFALLAGEQLSVWRP